MKTIHHATTPRSLRESTGVVSLLLLAATATVAIAGEGEPLRVLGVGDYHMGQGKAMQLLQQLLVAGGQPAVVMKVGNVHSDLVHEWEERKNARRGSFQWITGTGEKVPAAKLKQVEASLAKGPPAKPSDEDLADPKKRKTYEDAIKRYARDRRYLPRMQMSGLKPNVVILSAGSTVGFGDKSARKEWPTMFNEAAKNFKALAEEQGATAILLGTMKWSARTKPSKRKEHVAAYDAGYAAALAEAPMIFAPAYRAFDKAYEHEGLQPFAGCRDGHGHYGGRSAYLYACCMYAAVTGKSPVGLPVPEVSYPVPDPDRKKGDKTPQPTATLTPEQGKILQELAWAAHREWVAKERSEDRFNPKVRSSCKK